MSVEREAVVVPASKYAHGCASIRSLADAGVYTIAAVADETLPVAASRFCDEVARVPHPDETPAYRDALLELAARPDVRTIVPHRPQDSYLLAKHRKAFETHIHLAVPEFERLQDVLDRKRLVETAESAGVPVPETSTLADVDGWNSETVVKSRYNLLTEEFVDSIDHGETEVVSAVEHVSSGESVDTAALVDEMNHSPIVQEYIEGADQYVFGALYDHGEPLATFQHRQLRGTSYTGGGGVYRETVDIPELETVGRSILDELEWHGLACIEYIEDAETGEFVLVEINPRMWQSLPCATRAGAAFPQWYWLQALGRADRIEPGYEVGVRTHYLYGELGHLMSVRNVDSPIVEPPSVASLAFEIARSCLQEPTFDYFRLDDPLPMVRQLQSTASKAIHRRL